jgi:hypothetical protein
MGGLKDPIKSLDGVEKTRDLLRLPPAGNQTTISQ